MAIVASVNKVTLVGNLGRDPESRSMQDGRTVVSMSVATSEGDVPNRVEIGRSALPALSL